MSESIYEATDFRNTAMKNIHEATVCLETARLAYDSKLKPVQLHLSRVCGSPTNGMVFEALVGHSLSVGNGGTLSKAPRTR